MTPQGFVKAAMANSATVRSETVRGARKTIVTFTAPNKMKFEGVIGDQNLVERIETWYGSPVLGDTKFEASFSAYKDFGGVKFPTHIMQRNGPYPILDLTVTDVKPNAAVSIEVPANIRNAPAAGAATLQAEKISDGIWMVQGTAKSVAIEMKDHLVVVDAPETEARSIAVIDAVKRAHPGQTDQVPDQHPSSLRPFGRTAHVCGRRRDDRHASEQHRVFREHVAQSAHDQSRSAREVGTHSRVRRRHGDTAYSATAGVKSTSTITPATCITRAC